MSAEVASGGLIRAGYLVPLLLAFALAARHGRYLPLWLAPMGSLGAYLAFYLGERLGVAAVPAALAATVASAFIGVGLHHLLFARHVVRCEPYPALIRGIALLVLGEGLLGLLTGGYALSYAALSPSWKVYVEWPLADTLRIPDLLAIASVVVLAPLLWLLVERTRIGLSYRATSSNRELAAEYGLPVAAIDYGVLAFASLLAGAGGIVYGLRYGLTPQMMTAPALDVVAVVVAMGVERLLSGSLVLLGVGVLQAFCQATPGLSSFENAVSYALLAAALTVRHVALPAWRAQVWPQGRGPAGSATPAEGGAP
jgi:branched-subunit amino acid ABC-type transport system permease component